MSADLVSLVRGRTQSIRAELSKQLACVEKCATAIRKASEAAPSSFEFKEPELAGYLQHIKTVSSLDYVRAHSILIKLRNAKKTVWSDLNGAQNALERGIEALEAEKQALGITLEDAMRLASNCTPSPKHIEKPENGYYSWAFTTAIVLWLLILGRCIYTIATLPDAGLFSRITQSVFMAIIATIGCAIILLPTFWFLSWIVYFFRAAYADTVAINAADKKAANIRATANACHKDETARLGAKVAETSRNLSVTQEAIACVKNQWLEVV